MSRCALAALLAGGVLASGCALDADNPQQPTTAVPARDGGGDTQPLPDRPPVQAGSLHTPNLAQHMRDDAPPRYVVKPGDTLWAIAGYYLDDPWYWPQLWDANPDIANPHRIYPGEVLILSRSMNGQPSLSGRRTEHLSPRIREKPLTEAVPTIPYDAIADFLDSPQLVDKQTLAAAPYAVSFDDQHLVAGRGARLYIRGLAADSPDHFQLVRHDGVYRDARNNTVLGQQALPIGEVTITDAATDGGISVGVIDSSNREALAGDRLLPISDDNLARDFHPQAPAESVRAHIISVYGGVTTIGQYDVVTLDRGGRAGLRRGDVLNTFEAGRRVADPIKGDSVTLPEVYAGQLMVFKTEPRVSFALVMQARRAIHIDDVARSPAG